MLFADTCIVERVHPPIGKAHLIATVGNFRLMTLHIAHQALIHILLDAVIAVYKADIASLCLRKTLQASIGDTAVFLMDRHNALITKGILVKDAAASVAYLRKVMG